MSCARHEREHGYKPHYGASALKDPHASTNLQRNGTGEMQHAGCDLKVRGPTCTRPGHGRPMSQALRDWCCRLAAVVPCSSTSIASKDLCGNVPWSRFVLPTFGHSGSLLKAWTIVQSLRLATYGKNVSMDMPHKRANLKVKETHKCKRLGDPSNG